MPDERVQSAIINWAPRFTSQGVDYNDFQRTTARISRNGMIGAGNGASPAICIPNWDGKPWKRAGAPARGVAKGARYIVPLHQPG